MIRTCLGERTFVVLLLCVAPALSSACALLDWSSLRPVDADAASDAGLGDTCGFFQPVATGIACGDGGTCEGLDCCIEGTNNGEGLPPEACITTQTICHHRLLACDDPSDCPGAMCLLLNGSVNTPGCPLVISFGHSSCGQPDAGGFPMCSTDSDCSPPTTCLRAQFTNDDTFFFGLCL